MTLSLVKSVSPEPVVDTKMFEYRLISPSKQHYEMPNIWQLVAGNLAANGDVQPETAMKAAKDIDFDFHDNTRVVAIIHETGRLAGTFSYTLNSDQGMPITRHFSEELSFIQQKHKLINGWRFSMSPLFQSSLLRRRSMTLYKQLMHMNEADAFVIYYNQRLEAYYRRMFNGYVAASKSISFDGVNDLTVNMMVCQTTDNLPDPRYMHEGILDEHALVL